MLRNRILEAKKRLLRAGIAGPGTFDGCSDGEIEWLEEECGVDFPQAYRYFLCEMGKRAGTFMKGSEWGFDKLVKLQGIARELFQRAGGTLTLQGSQFVFLMHQGYQFLFFDTRSGDDPAVYHYSDRGGEPRLVATAFTDWLLGCVEDEIAIEKELRMDGGN